MYSYSQVISVQFSSKCYVEQQFTVAAKTDQNSTEINQMLLYLVVCLFFFKQMWTTWFGCQKSSRQIHHLSGLNCLKNKQKNKDWSSFAATLSTLWQTHLNQDHWRTDKNCSCYWLFIYKMPYKYLRWHGVNPSIV